MAKQTHVRRSIAACDSPWPQPTPEPGQSPRTILSNRRETKTVTVQPIACHRQQAVVSTSQFLFGASGMMARLRKDVAAASRADVNVLIVGEASIQANKSSRKPFTMPAVDAGIHSSR